MRNSVLGIFFTCAAVLPLYSQTVSVRSEPVLVQVGGTYEKKNKPALAYLNVAFKDETRDQTLAPFERARINFLIRNLGKASSQRLLIQAKIANEVTGIIFSEVMVLDSLAAGRSKEVSLPVEGSPELYAGTAVVAIEIKEEFEYDPDQIEINIPTEEFKEPLLKIASLMVSSETGKIEPEEPLILKVGVRNHGGGIAANVQLALTFPDYVKAIDPTSVAFDRILPGEEKYMYVEFYLTESQPVDELPIDLIIKELMEKYGQDSKVNVKLR